MTGRVCVGTMLLLEPSATDFNLAITAFRAVSDYEVIAAFVPSSLRTTVKSIDARIAAILLAAMVQDDESPRSHGHRRIDELTWFASEPDHLLLQVTARL
jgi:hypothetical protein